jgi:hypothetical protein
MNPSLLRYAGHSANEREFNRKHADMQSCGMCVRMKDK